ncbi:ArsR/SmtB family transcription factor [Gemella cuniculi]|uniref:ArsR/SmtB family transcription factor n=1 Tax=Gemella cuniculi TaxID=150240 RepID=UPI000408B5F7|nr:metalloregulator ArsR/SmtB family transcription factor [Gemella cuniculi]
MNYYKEFKALSDEKRIEILFLLQKKEISAGEIVDKLGLSNSKVSYHLMVLKKTNLIKERKYKNYIFYSVKGETFLEIAKWLTSFNNIVQEETI